MNYEVKSVATILERELESAVKEWLRRVHLLPALTCIPLSDQDRTYHLPKLFRDVVSRLRLGDGSALPLSVEAAEHGRMRRLQGYSPGMLVEESRLFQVVTFHTLHLHRSELDQDQVLSDVMVIADEVDLQLTEAVNAFSKLTYPY